MLFVCAFHTISYLPFYVYILRMILNPKATRYESGYYVAIFMAFLYSCNNPFVYATKFDPVREVLLRLIPCKKDTE